MPAEDVSRRITEINGYWYLQERVSNGNGSRDVSYPASYGVNPPTIYEPKVIEGDSREVLKDGERGSVGLVVTSPPYFLLKEAPWGGDYDEYIDMLDTVWRRCYHLLDNGRRMVVNIGDEYTKADEYGRHKAIPIHADIIRGAEAEGFDYMGNIIWRKAQTMRSSGGGAVIGSYPYPTEFLPAYNHEYILIFKKPGRGDRPSDEVKESSKVPKLDWMDWYDGMWVNPGEQKENRDHSAPFPKKLPERCIRLFSFVGDVVVDPFGGSGTTPVTAMEWGRKGVGIDVNPTYVGNMEDWVEEASVSGMKHCKWVDDWDFNGY